MNIQEIYTKYKIMPSLQLHQYRVAGVAMYLCERVKMKIDTDNIIAACLLHDMGNIIKIHNANNEKAWLEVLKWEALHRYFFLALNELN